MNYPRRSFLRDSAVLSLAAALGIRPSFAVAPACEASAAGVRVFFAGSWLFCHDPHPPSSEPPTMLAVALDPSLDPTDSMDLPHTFPFGKWEEPAADAADSFFNDTHDSLAACALDTPFVLHIDNTTGGAADVNALFDQTNKVSRFIYLTAKPKQPYKVQDPGGLRVIRLPIPANIIPAAYRTDAIISGATSVLQQSGDTTQGIATTHIFQYPNATSLTFAGTQENPDAGSNFLDYHFHTVAHADPRQPPDKDMPPHAPRMFQRLLDLLTPPPQIALQTSGPEDVVPGPCVLDQVSNREQEVPKLLKPLKPKRRQKALKPRTVVVSRLLKLTLATCDSGGVGVGCPPEGCDA